MEVPGMDWLYALRSKKDDVNFKPLRSLWLYHPFSLALTLLMRVPLRVIVGKPKRNRVLKHNWLYQWVKGKELCYLWGSEDYECHWGFMNFAEKRILDIGADWGSTAQFFLARKAAHIVALEANSQLYRQLCKNSELTSKVTPIHLRVKCPEHFEWLIKRFQPHILKIDCEDCEKHLPQVTDNVLLSVDEYAIECHSIHIMEHIRKKLHAIGYTVKIQRQISVPDGICHNQHITTVLYACKK